MSSTARNAAAAAIDLKDMRRYGGYGWAWSGLAPDDSALLVRDVSSDEIYSLDVELP